MLSPGALFVFHGRFGPVFRVVVGVADSSVRAWGENAPGDGKKGQWSFMTFNAEVVETLISCKKWTRLS